MTHPADPDEQLKELVRSQLEQRGGQSFVDKFYEETLRHARDRQGRLSLAALRVADAQLELEDALKTYRLLGGGKWTTGS